MVASSRKILDVPLVSQKGKYECGLGCLDMLLQYDGAKIKYRELQKAFDANAKDFRGLYPTEMGSFLLAHDYKVGLQGFHPSLFNQKQVGLNQRDLQKHIVKMRTGALREEERYQYPLLKLTGFMRQGGKMTVKIPGSDDLRNEIDNERPVIVAATNRFVHTYRIGYNRHYMVVIGYDDDGFYVNDPSPIYNKKGTEKYTTENMMYAVHAYAADSVSGGVLLKTRPGLR